MKILFTIKSLDNATGGAERVLVDIASGLADKGHDVSVLSFDPAGGKSFYPLSQKISRISLGIGNVDRKATFLGALARIAAIRKVAVREKPDICIAFMHSSFILAAFALIGTSIPVIASEHTVPAHYKNKNWEYVLFFFSCFLIKNITVVSETVKSMYPASIRKKMTVIANSISSAKTLANPGDKTVKRKIILNVGRLSQEKNQKMLIEAFAELAPDYPDWDVRIVGEGDLRNDLEATIRKYSLENRIYLPGATLKIQDEYQKAHIFALPSTYESFGLATAEAMAHGLPAIGLQRCPGTNELIIHEKNGFLVEGKHELTSFIQHLKSLMDSAQLRADLGHQGQERVKVFTKDDIIKEWEKIIWNACSADNKSSKLSG